jgi:NitT/TauT family transport system substrate-binding protein
MQEIKMQKIGAARFSISRRKTLALLGGATGAALVGKRRPRAATLDKISFLNSWVAQPEQGGFYQALANGIYKDYGLDADIRNGGPQLDGNTQLLSGHVDAISGDAFTAISYASKNLPFLCVAAFMQKDPRIIMSHPNVGNDKLPDLKGKPILVATFGRTTFWPWLREKYGFTDDQIRPYTFNMAPFLADKNISMQGFVSSEPLDAKKAGIDPVIHLLADYGFANYQTTVATSAKMVKERPEVLQRFVDASIKGWYSYLYGDPAPGNALIKKINPDISDEKIAYAITMMKDYGIVDSGDTKTVGIGAMTDAHWADFYNVMSRAGALPTGVDVKQAYVTQFVNKSVGLP